MAVCCLELTCAVYVDGVPWESVRFFTVALQYPTYAKQFSTAIFSLHDRTSIDIGDQPGMRTLQMIMHMVSFPTIIIDHHPQFIVHSTECDHSEHTAAGHARHTCTGDSRAALLSKCVTPCRHV